MSVKTAPRPGRVSRNRFMVVVLGGIGGVIGLFYLGQLVRYLYPQGGSDTPPLPVTLGEAGVTPQGGVLLSWNRGVAGPFYYPMNLEKSVVVGMFVEQKVADGRLTADNLRAVEQTCTHLGCPVNWIATDNRYECPCHGSQFNRNTTVYHGPAPRPLWQHKYTLSGNTMTIYGREIT